MPAFEHASEPRAVTKPKSKYRDDADIFIPNNILKDPRVAKGSTYSNRNMAKVDAQALLSRSQNVTIPDTKPRERRRKPKKKVSLYDQQPTHSIVQDDLDLTPNLIEQIAPIATDSISTQTANFEPRPDSPPYIPQKTGIDTATQLDDECFDFDTEVEPLLQVIIGKTLEQSLLEVEQEEELNALEMDYQKLTAEKNAESQRIRDLEKEKIAELRAKNKKLQREREFAGEQDDVRFKVAALRHQKEFMPLIIDEIYEEEVAEGKWILPTTDAIKNNFMPWLLDEVDKRLKAEAFGGQVVDSVLTECLKRQVELYELEGKKEKERLEKLMQEEENRRAAEVGRVRINITKETLGLSEDRVVGPLEITGLDTVGMLEAKIVGWLQAEEIEFVKPEAGFLQLGVDGGDGTVIQLDQSTRVLDIHGSLAVLKPPEGEGAAEGGGAEGGEGD